MDVRARVLSRGGQTCEVARVKIFPGHWRNERKIQAGVQWNESVRYGGRTPRLIARPPCPLVCGLPGHTLVVRYRSTEIQLVRHFKR